jgi:type IV pilus assembly protein PilA
MKTMQKGFTLIELMIVIAIIGILAAIAIPQYNDYVARSQASAGLAEVTGGRTAYEEKFQRGQAMADVTDVGLPSSTERCDFQFAYDSSTQLQDDAIRCDLKGNPAVNSSYVAIERTSSGAWRCDSDLDDEYLPEGCEAR